MRIVLHDFGGYAFSAQLARALASRGNEVLYLWARSFNTARGRVSRRPGDPPGLTMAPVELGEAFQQRPGLRRMTQERRYGDVVGEHINRFRVDVVISANSPLDTQSRIQAAAQGTGAAFVYWWQDVYSDAVERLLARRLGWVAPIIGARFRRLERRLLNQSDAIIPVANRFVDVLAAWQIPNDRVAVIPNWAPLDEVTPHPKRNPWAERYDLADRPVFLYAGTLGRKHDPEPLIRLAAAFPEASVVVISEGAGTQELRRAASGLTNVLMLPMQPIELLPEVLATADMLVATLAADSGAFSIPSKVLTYMTAARPILASMSSANAAAEAITAAGAGSVVEPSDSGAFVDAARALLNDPERRLAAGRAAREYAEREFGIEGVADKFERLLASARQHAQTREAAASDTAIESTESSGEHP